MDERYPNMEKAPGADYSELGTTGLKRTSRGIVTEEFVPKLRGTRAIKVYAEMEIHPIIGSVLFGIEMLMRNVDWSVRPASDSNADHEAASFVDECMIDMSQSWSSIISEVLSMMQFGFSPHEIVYKRRLGKSSDPTKNSRYTDGRIGWRKLPIRSQDTLDRWDFGPDGGVQGMFQRNPVTSVIARIPIEKMLLFRTTDRKGNPEGKSVLRSAYRPWYFMTKIENIEAIGVERDLAGLPTFGVPPEILSKDASAGHKALLDYIKRMVREIRRDEQEGLIYPLEYDESGNKKYDFSLMTAGGTRQFETSRIVERHARWAAMVALADFIMLGHEKVGSFALSSSKTDMFGLALNAWLDMIADVFNRFAIPRLFEINTFAVDDLPVIEHGDVETPDLKELGEYISKLAGAGYPLFPDEGLEEWLRSIAGIPAKGSDI
ncbi:MAG: DUF935 domain-containing protein [Synergistaceae bacterium]|jgi:hypothetical protein|nr:DUF935 domain-containing protein [Synergistaceae bacterium]